MDEVTITVIDGADGFTPDMLRKRLPKCPQCGSTAKAHFCAGGPLYGPWPKPSPEVQRTLTDVVNDVLSAHRRYFTDPMHE